MSRILLSLACVLTLGTVLSAQEVLTNAYFPEVGDTLITLDADSASRFPLEYHLDGGTNLDWNFTGLDPLRAELRQSVEFNENPEFPTADLVIRTPPFNESYYQVTNDELILVGLQTGFELLPDFRIVTPVTPARVERRANLTLGDAFSSQTENSVVVSPDSLPQAALDLIGSVINGVDSLRITTISRREDVVDAYGTVRLEDNFYQVIREKRTEFVDIRVAVRTGFLGYIDVTNTITAANSQLADFVGPQDTFDTYYYWNNDSKEAIVVSRHDALTDEPRQFTYKRARTSTSTRGVDRGQAKIKVYPNPATNLVTFEVEELNPGTYYLSLINLTGQPVTTRQFSPLGNQTRLSLDVSGLPNGLYLASLRSEVGRIITTKKLQVRR